MVSLSSYTDSPSSGYLPGIRMRVCYVAFLDVLLSTPASTPRCRLGLHPECKSVLLDDNNLLLGLVEAFADSVFGNEIIVRYNGPRLVVDGPWMNRQIHPGLDLHRFVESNQWSFYEVIALAMSVEPVFGKIASLLKKLVIRIPEIFGICPGLQQTERDFLGLYGASHRIDEGLCRLSERKDPADFRIKTSRTVGLDQHIDLVSLFDHPVLEVMHLPPDDHALRVRADKDQLP